MSDLPLRAFHECAFTNEKYKRLVLNKISALSGGRIPWVKIYYDLEKSDFFDLSKDQWKNIRKAASRENPLCDAKHFMSLIYWLYNVKGWKISNAECKNCADDICDLVFGCSIDKRYERLVRRSLPSPPQQPTPSKSPESHTTNRPSLSEQPAKPDIADLASLLTNEKIDNDLHYSAHIIDVLGRDREQHTLYAFLENNPDKGFLWLQLAGAGGQGKSRLAFDLVVDAKEDHVWDAGFLSEKALVTFEGFWPDWQPTKPTLIVIDYILGREHIVAPAFQALNARYSEFKKPVRLLLVERQRWDRGGIERPRMTAASDQKQGNEFLPSERGRADWFIKLCGDMSPESQAITRTRFADGVIELERLNADELVSLVRDIAKHQGQNISLADDRIRDALERIDKDGRPLFAYLIAQQLADGPLDGGWTREDLLTAAIEREQKKRWAVAYKAVGRSCPSPDDDMPSIRLARLATMIEGIDNFVDKTENLSTEELPQYSSEVLREALILVDAPRGNGSPFSGYVPPLQPDLLGEWFVLWAFCNGFSNGKLLARAAWKLKPDKMAAFLQRCAQDFPHRFETHQLLEIPPPDEDSRKAYGLSSTKIFGTLNESKTISYPSELMGQIEIAATHESNLDAIALLGYCKASGTGFKEDIDAAIQLLLTAADAGHTGAMRNLGVSYCVGLERDPEKAIYWFRKAADAGNVLAMVNVGIGHLEKNGPRYDPNKAIYWLQKAAEGGEARGALGLGEMYATGKDVKRDSVKAMNWFQKAADAGEPAAMFKLGIAYADGKDVECDAVKAIHWFRMAANAGDADAMVALGKRHTIGDAVERDPVRAIHWFQKAAETGHIDAMLILGIRYDNGIGIERNPVKALPWLRKAADAGDAIAKFILGARYGNGIILNPNKPN